MSNTFTTLADDTVGSTLVGILNANFDALRSLWTDASGLPSSPVAYQLAIDASASPKPLKMRNAANSAWVTILPDISLAGGGLLLASGSAVLTGDFDFNSHKGINLAAPTNSNDAYRKTDADTLDTRLKRLSIPFNFASFPSAGTMRVYGFIRGGAATALSVGIVASASVATHATNYYTFRLKNLTTGNVLCTKGTDTTAITADTVFDLGTVTNATIAADAVLAVECIVSGTPTALAAANGAAVLYCNNN